MAILTTEIPFTFVVCSLFAIIDYWMTNLTSHAANFFAFWALLELSAFVAQVCLIIITIATRSDFKKIILQASMALLFCGLNSWRQGFLFSSDVCHTFTVRTVSIVLMLLELRIFYGGPGYKQTICRSSCHHSHHCISSTR